MSRFLDWLADLDRDREPQRSRHMPRRPMKPAVRSDFERIMAERSKLRRDDPRAAGVELEAAWFTAQLAEQARDYERKLAVCYSVIAALITLGSFAIAWLR